MKDAFTMLRNEETRETKKREERNNSSLLRRERGGRNELRPETRFIRSRVSVSPRERERPKPMKMMRVICAKKHICANTPKD